MLMGSGEITQHTAQVQTLGYWVVFGWFMLGVALRQGFTFFSWLSRPVDPFVTTENAPKAVKTRNGITLGQCLAMKAQGVIGGVVVAWIWVGGHLWNVLASFETPLLDKIPHVGADQLSSIGVGFAIEWLVVERIVKRFGLQKKPA